MRPFRWVAESCERKTRVCARTRARARSSAERSHVPVERRVIGCRVAIDIAFTQQLPRRAPVAERHSTATASGQPLDGSRVAIRRRSADEGTINFGAICVKQNLQIGYMASPRGKCRAFRCCLSSDHVCPERRGECRMPPPVRKVDNLSRALHTALHSCGQ